jgi:hypothetical protein
MNTKIRLMVQYIGRREFFEDRLYGSGLTFVRDQIRSVPVVIARKLLRHSDNFAEPKVEKEPEKVATSEGDQLALTEGQETGDKAEGTEGSETVGAAESAELSDETDAQLERGRIEREQAEEKASNIQDIHDTVNFMEKDALKEFAFTQYKQNIDKRQTVEAMRAQVHQFIDQFGVA